MALCTSASLSGTDNLGKPRASSNAWHDGRSEALASTLRSSHSSSPSSYRCGTGPASSRLRSLSTRLGMRGIQAIMQKTSSHKQPVGMLASLGASDPNKVKPLSTHNTPTPFHLKLLNNLASPMMWMFTLAKEFRNPGLGRGNDSLPGRQSCHFSMSAIRLRC